MELEEINIADIEEKVSIKKQYFDAAGNAISLDYFLFTCWEEEKTLRFLRKDGITASVELSSIYEQENNPDQEEKKTFTGEVDEETQRLLQKLLDRYATLFPELAGSGVLDYQAYGTILSPFVEMTLNTGALLRERLALSLPVSPSNKAKIESLWSILETEVKARFAGYSEYMLSYLHWSFHSTPPVKVDLKDLPPVGRYLPLLYASQKQAQRQANSKFDRADRGERESGRDRERERQRPEGRSEGSRTSSNRSTEADERAALEEVDQILAQIGDSEGPVDILLKPQNSYLRRAQHKRVRDFGFDSKSEGEGSLRALRIVGSRAKR